MSKKQAEIRMKELVKEINYHNRRYYLLDQPEISDAHYDAIYSELVKFEKEYPDLVKPDSPTQRVGDKVSGDFDSVTHAKRRMSLEDAFSFQEIQEFDARVSKLLATDSFKYVCELKIDGLQIVLTYKKGRLFTAATRGDGRVGEDVTHIVRTVRDIPLELNEEVDIVVSGEIYISKSDFQDINQKQSKLGKPIYANPRNLAAGTVRQLDPQVASQRRLRSFVYDIDGDIKVTNQIEALGRLKQLGFSVNQDNQVCNSLIEVKKYIDNWDKRREQLAYETDGVVVKLNDIKQRKKMGSTAKSPRWAIAFKFPAEQKQTRILDIVIQVGRQGTLTPVAVLEPINLDGSMVSRATLHNEDEIKRKDVRMGDLVVVQKAGDIIPEVVSVIKKKRLAGAKAFKMPQKCPVCRGDVVRIKDEVAHRCVNRDCFVIQLRKLEHFVSRAAFDIEGLGKKIVEQLYNEGLVRDPSDFFKLKEGDVQPLERFADKSASNLIQSIQSSKVISLDRFIYALGMLHVGDQIARDLTNKLYSLDLIREASVEELQKIEGVGKQIAESIYDFFRDKKNIAMVDNLIKAGVEIIATKKIQSNKLNGKIFVLTGTLKSISREEAKDKIRDLGGKVSSSISQKTDYLIAGSEPGSKYMKAEDMGVKIINEEEFSRLLI